MVARAEEGRLVLSMATWLTLIGMIVTAISANLALIYGMSGNLQKRMDALDDRWQARTITITQELKADIRRVEDRIPPEWFRGMVDRNTERIDSLEKVLYDHVIHGPPIPSK